MMIQGRLLRAALVALAVTMVAGSPAPVAAQDPITRDQAERLIQEIRQIREVLQQLRAPQPAAAAPQRPADERVKIDLRGANAMGRDDAPVTMVEFTDLECPFCRTFHTGTFEQIKRDYIDTGKVRFVSRDFPLDFHANARPAALAVRCAGEQGKFWEMRHRVTVSGNALSRDTYFALAKNLGLDITRFGACVGNEKYKAAVDQDVAAAVAAGVNGTPTFVVGPTAPDGVEGQRIVGAVPYAVFETAFREALGQRAGAQPQR
jgi:protein-disulfide isomerase